MSKLKALVAMECMGNTRDALRLKSIQAFSCDVLPDVLGSKFHITGDVYEHLESVPNMHYDLGIAHPSCPMFTVSSAWAFTDGPYHQKVKPETLTGQERRAERDGQYAQFCRLIYLLSSKCKRWAIENPVGTLSTLYRKPNQTIQPYDFGDDASKRTCLWTRGLPKLIPTSRVPGRIVEWPKGSGRMVERWSNQTDSGQNRLPPSSSRWLARAETYPGISAAIADQWGGLLFEEGFELT